ncbi:hypothetical protein MOUN0_B04082 [Monosporozyma unispora]|nr:hypothetical protein C6P44_001175 [Kazachstania unispora]
MFEVILDPLTSFMEYVNNLNAPYNALSYEEQKAMSIFQRIIFYNWTFEMYCCLIMVGFYVAYQYGVSTNLSIADKLFNSLHVYFKNELNFARVGLTSLKSGSPKLYLDQHLHTWFTTFATGRSAIDCINVKVHLKPRNNPISLFIETFLGYFFSAFTYEDLEEFVEVEIKPNGVYVSNENANANNNKAEILHNFKFVTSIVNKTIMDKIRIDRYFLSLTHVTENDKIPKEFVFMSEVNQINDFIYKYTKGSFNDEVLRKSSKLLQFISFTDLPDLRPEDGKRWTAALSPRCIIRTKVPTSAKELDLLNKLIGSMVEVYDNFTRDLVQKSGNAVITPDVLKKINNLRQGELARIEKIASHAAMELAKEEKKELIKEKRRELKKSGELQSKELKMREKRERRQRNKQKQRMTTQ